MNYLAAGLCCVNAVMWTQVGIVPALAWLAGAVFCLRIDKWAEG